jgi:hypothetical protein
MQVNLSTESPDLPEHKCLALGIFSVEKPPRGICGFIDWRLNGFISREMKRGRISGEFMEKVIILPYPPRIKSEILFLFGLGPKAELTYDRIYTAAYQIVGAADGMLIKSFATDLIGDAAGSLPAAGIVEAMVTGIFDYLSQDVEKLAGATSCIVTTASRTKDVSAGIRQFKSHVKDMGTVDFGALEDSLPEEAFCR